MAKYDWKIEPRDEDWSDDTYAYFLIHINLKKMVEYLTKEFKKDWWFKADFGQDNCYIVAENNDFPVRLFFTFEEGGWADITRHYTDGATLKDDHLGSWHFGKYDVDYSYAVIRDNIENYFYKFEESMKEEKKSIKESEYDDYVNLDNLHFGYNDEYGFMEFRFYKNIQIKYGNGYTIIFGQLPSKEWAFAITDVSKGEGNLIDSRVNFVKKDTLVDLNNALKNLGIDKTWNELSESKKSARKSLKESFEYEGAIPLDEVMNILTEEWQDNSNGGVFGNSSHYDDEARDEDRYIEISAIVSFNSASNWGFINKHVQKLYDDECDKIYKEVDEDYDAYDDVLNEYDPILFVLTIDLKELLVYADVDLGNGLGSTEVARERLADNEKDFRKQIQRMIDAF